MLPANWFLPAVVFFENFSQFSVRDIVDIMMTANLIISFLLTKDKNKKTKK